MTKFRSEKPNLPPMIIGQYDRVQIRDVDYRSISSDEFGHVLVRVTGRYLEEGFSHEQLWQLSNTPEFRHDRDWYAPGKARARTRADVASMADLPKGETSKVLWRFLFCQRFMQREADGRAHRSDASMAAAIDAIFAELVLVDIESKGRVKAGDQVTIRLRPSVRTLRRWLAILEECDFEPYALRDGFRHCGRGSGSRIEPDVYLLMVVNATHYASERRPTMAACYGDFVKDLEALNKKRLRAGLEPFAQPCDKTFLKEIKALDAFEVYAKRNGLEKAKKKFRLITSHLDIVRPGERVELDEWSVPLMQVLRASGVWDLLSPEVQDEIGRDPRRWSASVALDVATRCVLGLRLAPNPNAHTNTAVLKMAASDKGRYADAVGTLSSWEQALTPETVSTDGGKGYVNDLFRRRLADLGSTHLVPPGGTPHMRPFIERLFLTARLQLVARFKGQTYMDVVDRGEYPAEARANLRAEDVAAALVRYVVDIYHNRPHAGLGGETPASAWRRLTKMFGIIPPPSQEKKRHVFGEDLVRTLSTRGVRVLGLYYRSKALGELFLSRGGVDLDVRIDPDDLGRISVMVGGAWHGVACSTPGLDGVSVRAWLASVADLRRRFADESRITLPIVHEAIGALGSLAAAAEARAGVAAPLVTSEHVDRAERDLVRGFEVPEELAPATLPPPSSDPREGATAVGGCAAAPETAAPDDPGPPERETGIWFED